VHRDLDAAALRVRQPDELALLADGDCAVIAVGGLTLAVAGHLGSERQFADAKRRAERPRTHKIRQFTCGHRSLPDESAYRPKFEH
jgi:hypothetical protein